MARNPTTEPVGLRPDVDRMRERTGFHSEVAAPADPQLEANSPEANSPASAGLRSGIWISVSLKWSLAIKRPAKMRTRTVNSS